MSCGLKLLFSVEKNQINYFGIKIPEIYGISIIKYNSWMSLSNITLKHIWFVVKSVYVKKVEIKETGYIKKKYKNEALQKI